jgi:hypothetical protein
MRSHNPVRLAPSFGQNSTEDNGVSQRRNGNGEVMTFPTRQHVRAYLKEQMAAERVQ